MEFPLINWPWSRQIKVRCKDGSIRYYYKDVDDIYPLESKDHTRQIEMAANSATQLEARVNTSSSTHLAGIFVVFDKANQNFILELRAAYGTYQDNPCSMDKWHKLRTEEIIESQKELRTLLVKSEIEIKKMLLSQNVVNNDIRLFLEDVKKSLTIILRSSNEETILDAVSAEMKKIDGLMEKWGAT